MKKTVCILLVVLTVLSAVLCSCNSTPEESKPEVSAAPTAYVPHLGDTNAYNGKVLKILTSNKGHSFAKEAFNATEITNEPVNDASYERNLQLEANYGFTIETIWEDVADAFLERAREDKASGMDDYDVMVTGLQTLCTLAAEGFFLDLNSLEGSNLCLSEPWWD